MQCEFYRSLDRQISIFGLKGRWIVVCLYGIGALLLIGIFAGIMIGTGVGISIAIGGIFVSFFTCMMLQTTRPAKIIDKWFLSSRMHGDVIRRETCSRIILEDAGYIYYKKNCKPSSPSLKEETKTN